jgi:hypothetical protein
VFSGHTLGLLIKDEQHLNATRYLNIIANQVPPFMVAVYPSASCFLQQDYATRLVQEWFQEQLTEFTVIMHLWEEMKRAIQSRSTPSQLDTIVGSIGVNMGQRPCGTLNTFDSLCRDELGMF